MNISGHLQPEDQGSWWPQYREVLKNFFAENYSAVEDQISTLLAEEEVDELFSYALYRLWLEVLHLQKSAHPHHPQTPQCLLTELSGCLKNIAHHSEPRSPMQALYQLSCFYLGKREEVQHYCHRNGALPSYHTRDPYHEELYYKLLSTFESQKTTQNQKKVELPFALWTAPASGSSPAVDLPLYDYLHLQTLISAYLNPATFESCYDDFPRQTLMPYISQLFGANSPLEGLLKSYQALEQGQLKLALNESLSLSLAYPQNPTFRALVHRIQAHTSDPISWLHYELKLLEATLAEKHSEAAAFSLLSKICSAYLRLQCQEDYSLPEALEQSFRKCWEAVQKRHHLRFDTALHHQERGEARKRKAWLCYISHKEYLHLLSEDQGEGLMLVSLQRVVQKKDWVYMVRKTHKYARMVGIYEIKVTLPHIFGMEKNTVLRPILSFAQARLPSIKLPLEETDVSDDADLKRRFGAELSFELGAAAHGVLLGEMKDQMFLDPSLITHLQHKWNNLA